MPMCPCRVRTTRAPDRTPQISGVPVPQIACPADRLSRLSRRSPVPQIACPADCLSRLSRRSPVPPVPQIACPAYPADRLSRLSRRSPVPPVPQIACPTDQRRACPADRLSRLSRRSPVPPVPQIACPACPADRLSRLSRRSPVPPVCEKDLIISRGVQSAMAKSLDEIHQKRPHSHSPTPYYSSSQEARSGDSDYDYSEERALTLDTAPCDTIPALCRLNGVPTYCHFTFNLCSCLRGMDRPNVCSRCNVSSDLQPALDRVRSASTTCLRPDAGFHSPERIQPTSILRGSRWRRDVPLHPFDPTGPVGSCKSLLRDRAHPHGVHSSPAGSPLSVRRGRQLPQLPAKGSSAEQEHVSSHVDHVFMSSNKPEETALAVEDRSRHFSQMRVSPHRLGYASSGHDQDVELKNKRDSGFSPVSGTHSLLCLEHILSCV
ncbi:hypothetical protein P4O66_004263 [Electrophorus voltai]|uniref:Uncharacterized protein n=1 Tax=Electrophorus voltai TaxID=2609070 RepID=A0AAD9E0K6_9TELE|nr:hypothetical protein P4O66_004263 [Electrophorus voltai]